MSTTLTAHLTPPDIDPSDRRALGAWAAAALDALGCVDARDALRAAAPALGRRPMLELVAEARRRSVDDPQWQPVVEAGADALEDLHRAAQDAAADSTPAGPVRLQILRALAAGPMRPTPLARALGKSDPLISRYLSALSDEGLIAVEALQDDRRGRRYRLTEQGLAAQIGWTAPRAPTPASDPPSEGERQREAITQAIAEAIDQRRTDNALARAEQTLDAARSEAERIADPQLWIDATRELAVTRRQAGRRRAHALSIRELRRVGHGDRVRFASVSSLALALSFYEDGRRDGRSATIRLADLTVAARMLDGLAQGDRGAGDRVRQHHTWTMFAIGALMREQTALGPGLEFANAAARAFAGAGDVYGTANCLLLAGQCLRLRGQFGPATTVLEAAMQRGAEYGFDRLHVGAMVQLGEAARAAGERDRARRLLQEATRRCRSDDFAETRAFALCHLGAVAFMQQEDAEALRLFGRAHGIFERMRHGPGLGLVLRRQAALERRRSSTNRRGLERAARILADARHRYGLMRSPAGIGACLIEQSRIELAANRRPTRQVRELSALTRREPGLLALDPWLPALVAELAGDAAARSAPTATATAIEESSRALGQAVLATSVAGETRDWAWIRDELRVTGCEWPERAPTAADADEMAGEPRRHTPLLDESSSTLAACVTLAVS